MLSGVSTICFAASYAVALALEISRLLFRSGVRGAVMLGFAAAGLVAQTAFLYYRAINEAGAPLSSERDWYLVAAWVLVVVYLHLAILHPKVPFGLFLLPLALGLIGAATVSGQLGTFGPRAGLENLGRHPRHLDHAGHRFRAGGVRGRADVLRPGAASETQDPADPRPAAAQPRMAGVGQRPGDRAVAA